MDKKEIVLTEQQKEEQRKAKNTLRLFHGMKRDLNLLCWVLAEIATKLNMEAKTYMGEDESKDFEWLDKQIRMEIEEEKNKIKN